MFTKKQIRNLIVPLMVEQVLTSLMGTADTMMVSTAGSAAISAVSLVDSINVLIIYVFSAMATGGAVICAQYLGRKQHKEANDTGKQLMLTVMGLSILIMAAIIVLRTPLLKLIFGRLETDVMENARVYLLITALSYPFIALYNAAAALFRVDGKSRLTMVVSTVANVVNVVLNAVLIFGFGMGAAGAALATLVSRVVCAAALIYFLRQPRQSIVVRDYRKFQPDMKRIRHIISVGIPNGIENGMFQFGKLAIQSTISTLGTTAIAAQAMASVLEGFISRPAEGIGLGMMTIVGQCIGADQPDEARNYIRRLTRYAHAATILTCMLMAVLVRPITIISGMEPEAAGLTFRLICVICLVKAIIWTGSFIPPYGLRAAGDLRFCMMVSTATMWLCRMVVATVLVRVLGFGPMGVWIGMFCDWGVRNVIFSLRFRSGRWATKKVIKT